MAMPEGRRSLHGVLHWSASGGFRRGVLVQCTQRADVLTI